MKAPIPPAISLPVLRALFGLLALLAVGSRGHAADTLVYATIDEAIARGDGEDVKRHLQRDPRAVHGKKDAKLSPLHQAILRRQAKIAILLLEHGADVQAPDTAGRTPLHLAVERNDAAIVRELLRRKADPGKRDRVGWTPLHHAAAKVRVEIAKELLDAGMNPNLLSELGGTALHEAAASGSVEMVKLLLERGVNPGVRSKPGVTALDLAREYKHPEVAAVLLAPTAAPAAPSRPSDSAKPNILFIYLDDFGWRDASYMGSDFFETPHLDKLAAEGMVFTAAYAAAPNCAPSRACLLSGQYTPRHEVYNVGTRPRGNAKHRRLLHVPGADTLDPTLRTWAHQLQDAGYTTAILGKWHLSKDPRPYGFAVNIGGTHSGSPPSGYYPPHNVPGLHDAPDDEYLTDRLSDEAVKFIRSNREKPWCLYLSHFAVHTPLDAKRELLEKYANKAPGQLHNHVAMGTMVQSVDDGVGRIVAALDALELTGRTIVVFSSDNGGYGPATDMHPLKGYKGTFYEGGIRVPLFVKWPGVVSPGTKVDHPTINLDLYPTLCEMAGAKLPAGQTLDGASLVPLLRGEVSALGERDLFWHFPAYLDSYSVIAEQRDPLFRSRPCSVIRAGEWKLHQYFEDGGLELYNLREDIGETNDRSRSNPRKTKDLLARLEAWRAETKAPVPTKRNPQFDSAAEAQAIEQALTRKGQKDQGTKGPRD